MTKGGEEDIMGEMHKSIPLSSEKRKKLAKKEKEYRIKEAELLKGGAEYVVDESGTVTALELTDEQLVEMKKRAEAVKKREAELAKAKKREEALRLENEKYLTPEKQELRREMAEGIQDVSELYRDEIREDLKMILSLDVSEKERMRKILDVPYPVNVLEQILALRKSEADKVLVDSPFSFQDFEADPTLLEDIRRIQSLPEIRRAQLRALYKIYHKFDENFTEDDLDEYIAAGGDRGSLKFADHMPLVKVSEGVYALLPHMSASRLVEEKHAFIESNNAHLLDSLLESSGVCSSDIYGRDFKRYLILKAREHDNAGKMFVKVDCENRFGCSNSLMENLEKFYPSLREQGKNITAYSSTTDWSAEHLSEEALGELLAKIKDATGKKLSYGHGVHRDFYRFRTILSDESQ